MSSLTVICDLLSVVVMSYDWFICGTSAVHLHSLARKFFFFKPANLNRGKSSNLQNSGGLNEDVTFSNLVTS